MILISSEEAKKVRKFFPNVHIRRTANKFYMEENKRALGFLKQYRSEGEVVN